MKQKVLHLFSGGFDSVVLLHDLIEQGYEVVPLFFNYGQKGLQIELSHAQYWVNEFNLQMIIQDIPTFSFSKSAITNKMVDFDQEKDNDYLELRNLILFSYASSIAESLGIKQISSALIWGSSFPDTKAEFTKAFDSMIFQMVGIELYAPYVGMSKLELAQYFVKNIYYHDTNYSLQDILNHSITCNVPVNFEPCGICGGCEEIEEIRNKVVE